MRIKIEQNRRTKLERFNSDKIATISGALPILHTISEAAIHAHSHIDCECGKCMQPRRETSSSSSRTSSVIRLLQTFQMHSRCVRLMLQLLVHVNLLSNPIKCIDESAEVKYDICDSARLFFIRCVRQFFHSKFLFYYSMRFYSSCSLFPFRFHFRSLYAAEPFFRRDDFFSSRIHIYEL